MHVFCFLNNKCEDIATACLMVEVLMEVGVLLGRDLKPSPPIFHSLHPCISPQLATKPCYCYSLNLTFPYTSTQWWKWAFSFPTSGNSVSCTVKKHCQMHNRPNVLSALNQSTPLVQSRSFDKLWNLGSERFISSHNNVKYVLKSLCTTVG